MKLYIQLNNGYITDCITYPYGDYIEVEFETPLPDHFIAGCYKYLGNNEYDHDQAKHDEIMGGDE